MKKHIKVYITFFGYGEDDYMPCELCGAKDGEVHHINPRGMGGSKTKDDILNLMKLCRKHHDMAEAEQFEADALAAFHKGFIKYFQDVGRTWFEEPLVPPEFKIYPLLPANAFRKQ